MTALGADYSYARPGGAALAQAGVVSVGRYLAPSGDGREIEKAEYDDLTAHGISVWFVREGGAASLLDGYATGVSHAQTAVANLARLGLSNQVVYAAADFDVQPSQFPACDDYMRGFASVIGLERTGIYGGLRYINHCRDVLAKWYWQAGATSWNHDETGAVHIEQTTNTPPVPGTDHNFIYQANHGQVGSDSSVQGEEDMSFSFVQDAQSPKVYVCSLTTGNRAWVQSPYHLSLLRRLKANNAGDPMLMAELDICHSYLQAVNPDTPTAAVSLTDAQVTQLGADVAGKIPAAPKEFTITGKASA